MLSVILLVMLMILTLSSKCDQASHGDFHPLRDGGAILILKSSNYLGKSFSSYGRGTGPYGGWGVGGEWGRGDSDNRKVTFVVVTFKEKIVFIFMSLVLKERYLF